MIVGVDQEFLFVQFYVTLHKGLWNVDIDFGLRKRNGIADGPNYTLDILHDFKFTYHIPLFLFSKHCNKQKLLIYYIVNQTCDCADSICKPRFDKPMPVEQLLCSLLIQSNSVNKESRKLAVFYPMVEYKVPNKLRLLGLTLYSTRLPKA